MIVFTVDEIQDEGLALVGLNLAPQERGGIKRNARRFMENFASSPAVCAVIWHDLQSTNIPAAWISPKSAKEVRKFLLSMSKEKKRAEFDTSALARDLERHPRPEHDATSTKKFDVESSLQV
jgi:hypothetical protein